MDSGASYHITFDLSVHFDYTSNKDIMVCDGKNVPISHVDHTSLTTPSYIFQLTNVLYYSLFLSLNSASTIIPPLNFFQPFFLWRIWARGHTWFEARIEGMCMSGLRRNLLRCLNQLPMQFPPSPILLSTHGTPVLVIDLHLLFAASFLPMMLNFWSILLLCFIVMLVYKAKVISFHLVFPLCHVLGL